MATWPRAHTWLRENHNMRKNAQASTPLSADGLVAEQLLTVAQIAAHFQTGREEVHRWIRTGKLEAFRSGKLIRVRPQAVVDFTRRHLTVRDADIG